jgi:hypothetical protein
MEFNEICYRLYDMVAFPEIEKTSCWPLIFSYFEALGTNTKVIIPIPSCSSP